jgi:hypothetical protein
MNKADFISLVNTKLPDGAALPSSDHRDTMHTDPSSVAELVYSDEIKETQASSSIFSVVSVGIEYELKVQKIGRSIKLDGIIRNAGTSGLSSLLNIDDDDYKCIEDNDYICQGTSGSGEQIGVRIRSLTGAIVSDTISVMGILLPGESVRLSLTYNTQL